jgi:O-antigen ligase
MNRLPRSDAAAKTASRRHLWLAVVVVGVCFFVTEHELRMSLTESFSSSTDDLVELTSGGNNARRLAFLSLAMLGAYYFRRPSNQQFCFANGLALLIMFYVAWCAASIVWSIDPPMALRRFIVFAFCFIGAVGISRQLSVRELATLTLVVSASFLAIGIGAEIALGTFRPWAGGYRFAGTVHPNTQGLNLVMLCFSSYSLARDGKGKKLPLFCLFCLGFVFLILTKSRTSCGGAVLGLVAMWSLKASLRTQLLTGLGVVGTVAAAVLVNLLLAIGVTDNLTNAMLLGRAEQSGSLTGRVPLWTELSTYISERPLHGYGYESFWTADHVAAVSSALQWGIHEAHSAYVETILSVGIVGAIPVIIGVLIATWRARQRYLTTGETGYDFLFSLFLFALINSLTESGMVLPMFVPFLAGCGLACLAFYRAEQASGVCFQTNDINVNPQHHILGA